MGNDQSQTAEFHPPTTTPQERQLIEHFSFVYQELPPAWVEYTVRTFVQEERLAPLLAPPRAAGGRGGGGGAAAAGGGAAEPGWRVILREFRRAWANGNWAEFADRLEDLANGVDIAEQVGGQAAAGGVPNGGPQAPGGAAGGAGVRGGGPVGAGAVAGGGEIRIPPGRGRFPRGNNPNFPAAGRPPTAEEEQDPVYWELQRLLQRVDRTFPRELAAEIRQNLPRDRDASCAQLIAMLGDETPPPAEQQQEAPAQRLARGRAAVPAVGGLAEVVLGGQGPRRVGGGIDASDHDSTIAHPPSSVRESVDGTSVDGTSVDGMLGCVGTLWVLQLPWYRRYLGSS